jgi:hypothetical protein
MAIAGPRTLWTAVQKAREGSGRLGLLEGVAGLLGGWRAALLIP